MTAKRLTSAVLTLTVSLTTGCATLLNGGPSVLDVNVEHPPQSVTTTVTATATKQTSLQTAPHFQLRLDKGSDYVLTMQSPGYRTEQTVVNRSLHPGFWVDLALLAPLALLGIFFVSPLTRDATMLGPALILAGTSLVTAPVGAVSLITDLSTNAIWCHDQRDVRVRLIPETSKP